MHEACFASYGRGQVLSRPIKETFELIPSDVRATFMPGYGSIGKLTKRTVTHKGRGLIASKATSPGTSPSLPPASIKENIKPHGRGRARSSAYKTKPGALIRESDAENKPSSLKFQKETNFRISNSPSSFRSSSTENQPSGSCQVIYVEPEESATHSSSPLNCRVIESDHNDMKSEQTCHLLDQQSNSASSHHTANNPPADNSSILKSDQSSCNDSFDTMASLSKVMDKLAINENSLQGSDEKVNRDKSQDLETTWVKVSNISTQEVQNIVKKVEGSFYDCIPFYGEIQEIELLSDTQFKIKFKYRANSEAFIEAFHGCDIFSADEPIQCERLS